MKIKRPRSKQRMPKNAKKVFSGRIYNVYQWKQKMFDGTYATFERLKRADTVSIIAVTHEGKIILEHEQQPGRRAELSTVTGRVDPGEGIWEAAKRELLEETGYTAREWKLLHAYQPTLKIEWAIFTFVAKGCKQAAPQNLDAGEKISLRYVDFETFIKMAVAGKLGEHELKIMALEAKLDRKKMELLRKIVLG